MFFNHHTHLRFQISSSCNVWKMYSNINSNRATIHTKYINNLQEKAMNKELCLVVPAYNESGAIKEVIQSWETLLAKLNINFDIHIYNDGSKDNTLEILTAEAKNYENLFIHDKKNSGHGPTILLGYNENVNNYEWIFQIDSDNEMSPNDFSKLWEKRAKYDFLVGRRDQRIQPVSRRIVSQISRIVVRILFGKTIWDVNSPYRLMRTSSFSPIYKKIPADTLAPNLLVSGLAGKNKLRLYEVPVRHHCRTTGEVSIQKWKLFKFSLRSFLQTFYFRLVTK